MSRDDDRWFMFRGPMGMLRFLDVIKWTVIAAVGLIVWWLW